MGRLIKYILIPLLSFAAFWVRLYDISSEDVQSDEIDWLDRSAKLLENVKQGNFRHLTLHMPHPGLPPSWLMAVGQFGAARINARNGRKATDPGYIDPLDGARIAVASASALVVPVVAYGFSPFIGEGTAVLAATLLAFDPHHVGISRIAHLDTVFSLLVALLLLFYFRAVRSGRILPKLASGFLWGLCLAIKPTAVLIIGGLVLYKFIATAFFHRSVAFTERFISWSDIWAILAGQAAFAAIHTNFWDHRGTYFWRLGVESKLADRVYDLGMQARGHPALCLVLAFTMLSLIYTAFALTRGQGVWGRQQSPYHHICMASFLLSLAACTVVLLPAVAENIVRYWVWALGLKSVKHEGFGRVWEAPPYGYFGVALSRFSPIVLTAWLLGILLFYSALKRRSNGRHDTAFLMLCILSSLGWVFGLGACKKQALRYLLPLFPAFYVTAACGLVECGFLFSVFERKLIKHPRRIALVPLGLAVFASTFQAMTLLWSWPHPRLYFNEISGGLKQAVERRENLPFAGQPQAIRFLRQRAEKEGHSLSVGVKGSLRTALATYKRLFPGDKLLDLRGPITPVGSDYLLACGYDRYDLSGDTLPPWGKLWKVMSYKHQNTELLSVYKFPILDFKKAYAFSVGDLSRRTGTVQRYSRTSPDKDNGERMLLALPGRDRKGYLLFGSTVRVEAGRYRAQYDLGLPADVQPELSLEPARYALRIEFGRCSRVVKVGELSQNELGAFDVSCEYDSRARPQLRAYWFGTAPVLIGGLKIQAD